MQLTNAFSLRYLRLEVHSCAGVDVKEASKFACSVSSHDDDMIKIQGDVCDEVGNCIPKKWSGIDKDAIENVAEGKSK